MFVHGNEMTGTNFLNTPDGRTGWADYFLGEGYEVYLVDQPSRGRSAWQAEIDGPQKVFNTSYIESHFTAPERYHLWPQAELHTQWPGDGIAGDPVFDNFYASTMPSLSSSPEAAQKFRDAGSSLLDRIGSVILLTHSQSGSLGWLLADARPELVKGIIALEPIGPPFVNAVFPPFSTARPYGIAELPLRFSPPVASAEEIHYQTVNSIPNVTCYEQTSPAKQLANLKPGPATILYTTTAPTAIHILSGSTGHVHQRLVWLVTDAAGNLAVLPTFGPGTLLERSRTYIGPTWDSELGMDMLQAVRGTPLTPDDPYAAELGGSSATSSNPTSRPPPPGVSPSSPASGVSGSNPMSPLNPPQSRSVHTSLVRRREDMPLQAGLYDDPSTPRRGHSRQDLYLMGEQLFPLFCVSVNEHAWMSAGYGVWGKEEWLKKFWSVVDWEKVSKNYAYYSTTEAKQEALDQN